MVPVRSSLRAVPTPLALLAAALLVVLALVPTTPAAAVTTASVPQRAAADLEAFVGTLVEVQNLGTKQQRRPAYVVSVQWVFGESTLETNQTVVRSTADFAACADRPGGLDVGNDFLFTVGTTGGRLRAAACDDVVPATPAALRGAVADFGVRHEPGTPVPEEPAAPEPFADVTMSCASTDEAFTTTDLAAAGCPDLVEPPSVQRTVAPGIALVLVGLLGLLVFGRLGRRS
ncbi:MAG: hypothetical protein CMH83_04910 [Nocardioides sp.]|nr:hypothetical protein [Nocardioides sp.]